MVDTQYVSLPTYVRHDNLSDIYCGDRDHVDDYPVHDHLHPFDGKKYRYLPDVKNWEVDVDAEWAQVRLRRDALILAYRWKIERQQDRIALGLAQHSTLQPMLEYVQALRDIPETFVTPADVVFPSEP